MARFNKIQTLQAIIQTGMVPVYYNKRGRDRKTSCKKPVTREASEPSSLLTGRFRHEVFGELVKYAAKECPELVLA